MLIGSDGGAAYRFQGLPLVLSRSAMRELWEHGCEMNDALDVLEVGYDCAPGKRACGVLERCLDVGKKTMKAVAVRSFDHATEREIWLVVHFGITGKKR